MELLLQVSHALYRYWFAIQLFCDFNGCFSVGIDNINNKVLGNPTLMSNKLPTFRLDTLTFFRAKDTRY